MRDILKRSIIGLISFTFLSYLVYLFIGNTIIVKNSFIEQNILAYILLFLAFLYVLIFFSIIPIYFKISKISLFVLGLALIIFWDSVFLNDISSNIFISDFMKILWVVFTLFSFTNLFVTSKVKKQKQNSKVEIIEI